jgi:hypothetical protein
MNKREKDNTTLAAEAIGAAIRKTADPYIGQTMHVESSENKVDAGALNDISKVGELLDKEDNAEDRACKNMLNILTSFCGADFVIVVDGEVNGEIEALHLDSLNKGQEVRIDVAVFSTLHESKLPTLKDAKIYQVFANEYGYALIREFNNVTFVGEQTSISVDDIAPIVTFIYSCESYTNFRLPVDSKEVSKILGTLGE